ncbi:hypothetical protein PR048_010299 [Dryococelus australis]|uniref:HAT C-terminal dimerisation domain-containing protein n=1 Tax=Dryococelus australis TaxID=614101 RepID=A0ABQ9I2B2_9NEOP|nr:hypothetical protein PR048_010299 [Dryococelus australis]
MIAFIPVKHKHLSIWSNFDQQSAKLEASHSTNQDDLLEDDISKYLNKPLQKCFTNPYLWWKENIISHKYKYVSVQDACVSLVCITEMPKLGQTSSLLKDFIQVTKMFYFASSVMDSTKGNLQPIISHLDHRSIFSIQKLPRNEYKRMNERIC